MRLYILSPTVSTTLVHTVVHSSCTSGVRVVGARGDPSYHDAAQLRGRGARGGRLQHRPCRPLAAAHAGRCTHEGAGGVHAEGAALSQPGWTYTPVCYHTTFSSHILLPDPPHTYLSPKRLSLHVSPIAFCPHRPPAMPPKLSASASSSTLYIGMTRAVRRRRCTMTAVSRLSRPSLRGWAPSSEWGGRRWASLRWRRQRCSSFKCFCDR